MGPGGPMGIGPGGHMGGYNGPMGELLCHFCAFVKLVFLKVDLEVRWEWDPVDTWGDKE